jgi:TRAP transporter TAXI family solute receptor
MFSRKLRFAAIVTALALVAGCAGSTPASEPQKSQTDPAATAPKKEVTLTWTAGQVGGGWYTQAGGFAELVKGKARHLNIKVVPGAGVQNMAAIQQNKTELAWGLPPFVAASYHGQDPYKEKHPDMRLVMNGLGFVHIQVAVPAESPIQTLEEVFQKKMPLKVGTTPVGGSDEWVFRQIFNFYNTSYDDLRSMGGKLSLVAYSDLVTLYKDRNLDLILFNLAVPGAALQEASLARKMRILPMSEDLVKHLEQFGLSGSEVPAGSYKDVTNNDKPIRTVAMANTIVANANVPDEVVYDFVQAALSDLDGIRKVHPAFADFDTKDAVNLGDVPLHPGAAKAYKEAGLLK